MRTLKQDEVGTEEARPGRGYSELQQLQVSPLRFAPVEMTALWVRYKPHSCRGEAAP
jgi:hypothetical protein